jgi:hypothetical protein
MDKQRIEEFEMVIANTVDCLYAIDPDDIRAVRPHSGDEICELVTALTLKLDDLQADLSAQLDELNWGA